MHVKTLESCILAGQKLPVLECKMKKKIMISVAEIQKQCSGRKAGFYVSSCETLDFLNPEIMLSVCFCSSKAVKGHDKLFPASSLCYGPHIRKKKSIFV